MALVGASTSEVLWRVASISARNALTVGPEDVGKLAQVLAGDGLCYPAVAAGSGAACWGDATDGSDVASAIASASAAAVAAARVQTVRRTFAFDDADVDVEAVSVDIDFGDPLPAGAFVLGVYANVTEDWTDGGSGVFFADVGVSGGDSDRFTPTALDIDGGIAELTQSVLLSADGTQLAVHIEGDVNLSTLTGGSMDLVVVYFVPEESAG